MSEGPWGVVGGSSSVSTTTLAIPLTQPQAVAATTGTLILGRRSMGGRVGGGRGRAEVLDEIAGAVTAWVMGRLGVPRSTEAAGHAQPDAMA